MAIHKRRSTRKLEDLPGLFDNLDTPMPDPVLEVIEAHRKAQKSLRADSIEALSADALPKPKQLQFISFGSGSSGNSAYLGVVGEGGIIIDAGIDADKMAKALEQNCIEPSYVKGIILTHDHSDHVRFAYSLLRKLRTARLYSTPRTLNGILRRHNISKRIKDYHAPIFKEFAFDLGPFSITPFEVSHDGSDNVGFSITAYGHNFVVATDMGEVTERADHYMRQAHYLMIEANYDDSMLAVGRYPEYLKARIRSAIGHLDNMVTARYLAEIWEPKLTDVYLCHLSQDNNRPEIALKAVTDALAAKGISVADHSGSIEARQADVRVSALPRFDSSPLHILRLG